MKIRIWSWLASVSLVSTVWFIYWAVIYEIVVLNKPIDQALATNPLNMFLFFISLGVFFSAFLLKKTRFATINFGGSSTQTDTGSQWLSKKNKPKSRSILFRPETRSRSSTRVARRSFRVPGLRYMKRKIAWIVLLTDALIVLFTIPNGSLLVVTLIFFINGFYILDYIYKTRKPTILEERKAEKETTQ